MKITIINSGFVTGDFLKPVGYAGEMNSRKLTVTHPHFKDCYYQLLVKRYDGLYTLGIDSNGEAVIPPSLLRTAAELECQFVAMSTPDSVSNAETDTFIFQSNPFKLTVAPGLSIGGMSPVPPYEKLQEMTREYEEAKRVVDNSIAENNRILAAMEEAIAMAQQNTLVADIEAAARARYKEQIEELTADELESFRELISKTTVKSSSMHKLQLDMQYRIYKISLERIVREIVNSAKVDITNQVASFSADMSSQVMAYKTDIGGQVATYKDEIEALFTSHYEEFVESLINEVAVRFLDFKKKCENWQKEVGCLWDYDDDCVCHCPIDGEDDEAENDFLDWPLNEVGGMTKKQLARFVACMIKHLIKDAKCGCGDKKPKWVSSDWYKQQPTHSMTQSGQIIGG